MIRKKNLIEVKSNINYHHWWNGVIQMVPRTDTERIFDKNMVQPVVNHQVNGPPIGHYYKVCPS